MAAAVVDLCEAIKTYIEGRPLGTYSFTFNVYRTNFNIVQLESDATTNLWIYPSTGTANATEIYTRDTFLRRYTINLHLTNYIDGVLQDELDEALLLTEELEQSIENEPMDGWKMVQFESNLSGRPFFELEQAIDRNVFHSIISVEYGKVI